MTKSFACTRSSVPQHLIQTAKRIVRREHRSVATLRTFHDRGRRISFIGAMSSLAGIFIGMFLLTPAFAQEQRHAYSEYTCWFGGALANGHVFSSTGNGRNYQLENRYERLIYWKEPFAVRWVFEAIPLGLVGDPRVSSGRRVYAYGVGGSPVGAQVNFVHYRRLEPFLTSGGGFLYFNHLMFGQTRFNFTAQLGGGVQLFTANHRAALDLGYKYHHVSNANLGNQNPGMDSHMLFIGVSLFR